jgi:hypothetical protein
MPLTQQNQNDLSLPAKDKDAACGVACVVSVLKSLTGSHPADTDDVIFTRIATTGISRVFGSSPGKIADYLVAQKGRKVWFDTSTRAHTPLTVLMAAGLETCNATRLTNPPQHPAKQDGGPPYWILFLKVRGADARGHFVVSDGFKYMDPGAGGYINANFPHWLDFYDARLPVIVE